MYTISNRLKIFSISLIILGALGWSYSYVNSHKSLEEVKEILAHESSHGDSHGDSHEVVNHGSESNKDNHSELSHHSNEDTHAEHVMHQIHNRPYAALYVAAFFFMMIALGVLGEAMHHRLDWRAVHHVCAAKAGEVVIEEGDAGVLQREVDPVLGGRLVHRTAAWHTLPLAHKYYGARREIEA